MEELNFEDEMVRDQVSTSSGRQFQSGFSGRARQRFRVKRLREIEILLEERSLRQAIQEVYE